MKASKLLVFIVISMVSGRLLAANGAELFALNHLNGSYAENREVYWLQGENEWTDFMSEAWDKDCFHLGRGEYKTHIERIFTQQKMKDLYLRIGDGLSPKAGEICVASLLKEGEEFHSYYYFVLSPSSQKPEVIIFVTTWDAYKSVLRPKSAIKSYAKV